MVADLAHVRSATAPPPVVQLAPDPHWWTVRDVAGLYAPRRPMPCCSRSNEKPQFQCSATRAAYLPMDLGSPNGVPITTFRHGTLDLFAALNVAHREVSTVHPQHRARDFRCRSSAHRCERRDPLCRSPSCWTTLRHKAPPVHRWCSAIRRVHFPVHNRRTRLG